MEEKKKGDKALKIAWNKYERASKEDKVIMTYELFASELDITYNELKEKLNTHAKLKAKIRNKIIAHAQYLISKKQTDSKFALLYMAKLDKDYTDPILLERKRQYDTNKSFSNDSFKMREQEIRREERNRVLEEYDIKTEEQVKEEVHTPSSYNLELSITDIQPELRELIGEKHE